MSAGVMPKSPSSASKGFSSTPRKSTKKTSHILSRTVEVLSGSDVLSDNDTYSLLSPIYHDSFDSDEDFDSESEHPQRTDTSPTQWALPRRARSPVRCELPKAQGTISVESAASPRLDAWEVWLLDKARKDRLQLEKKAEEERLLLEKIEQRERMQEQKKIVVEEKIQAWMRSKREREKQEKELKQSTEEVKLEKEKTKEREVQCRAQEKYKEWLRRKDQERLEKKKKDKKEADRKEERERERRQTAEEHFQQWLATSNAKARASPSPSPNSKSQLHPKSPYDKSYPPPSFYNPVPWKPIHAPPPETPTKNASQRRPRGQPTKRLSTGGTRSRLLC